MCIRIRRATRNVPPSCHAGPSPGWTHSWSQRVRVLGLEVVGAVLETEQVARRRLRRGRRRRAPEPQLRPPHCRGAEPHPDEVADRVDRHLGVVGARLDAQVPTGEGGVDLVAGEPRQVGQRGRLLCGQAQLVEEARPHPERQRQVGRGKPQCLTGVGGRGLRVAVDGATGRGLGARCHALGRGCPALQQVDGLRGLVLAPERHDVLDGLPTARRRAADGEPRTREGSTGPEEPAPGEADHA